jgi:5-oxoprolinase (ATP-hydrolysing)
MNHAPEVELELFTHRFSAVAAEMGEMLQRTALSTNVRDRLDFSCALLDGEGQLLVNAPHIPVHLGALGLCVRSVGEALAARGETWQPGDTVITNHPAHGGSHLPDVTLLTPVFASDRDGPLGFVASRSHHAEIGGTRPGSMPPDARCLEEEGVVIEPRFLVRRGEARWSEIRTLFEEARHPSRSVDENLADLDAALAANQRGAAGLRRLAESHGIETVVHYMGQIQERAADAMALALGRLLEAEGVDDVGGRGSGHLYEAVETLDDGTPLAVKIRLEDGGRRWEGQRGEGQRGDGRRRGRAILDFAGSGPVHPGNLNATPAIVRSAVLYVLRLLLDEDLPLAEGLLRPIELRIPEGSLLAPDFSGGSARAPAVVGGNVETSQRLVDTLIRALDLGAGSQGTMNNVLFGHSRAEDSDSDSGRQGFGYYETVCGGAGAGPDGPGADAVHTHMTNTRITDPEILEHRYPVRLERFAVRHGSGGAGRHRGGDGAVRELTFLQPVQLSILSQHRTAGPHGAHGGAPGAPGRQRLVRADGTMEELKGIDRAELGAGDRLVLETPGGGGWGEPDG